MIWVPAQLVSAFHGDNITLTCFVEAHPTSLNYWEKDGVMVHQNQHYTQSQERGSPAYKVEMKLTITDAGKDHFGKYTCVAKNPRGQTDGSITLYGRKKSLSPLSSLLLSLCKSTLSFHEALSTLSRSQSKVRK